MCQVIVLMLASVLLILILTLLGLLILTPASVVVVPVVLLGRRPSLIPLPFGVLVLLRLLRPAPLALLLPMVARSLFSLGCVLWLGIIALVGVLTVNILMLLLASTTTSALRMLPHLLLLLLVVVVVILMWCLLLLILLLRMIIVPALLLRIPLRMWLLVIVLLPVPAPILSSSAAGPSHLPTSSRPIVPSSLLLVPAVESEALATAVRFVIGGTRLASGVKPNAPPTSVHFLVGGMRRASGVWSASVPGVVGRVRPAVVPAVGMIRPGSSAHASIGASVGPAE